MGLIIRQKYTKRNGLALNLSQGLEVDNQVSMSILKEFAKRYPNDEIITHVMAKMNYDNAPEGFYNVFEHFSEGAKSSAEGKRIGERLKAPTRLLPGKKIPQIEGKTLDGKKFELSDLKSKLILIEFWKASDQLSRANHQTLVRQIIAQFKPSDLSVLSISLDKLSDWWITAVQQDSAKWEQVNDLKGADSPNVRQWAIKRVPTYSLITDPV